MKDVWTRTFAFTSFTWLNTREHTRAWAPAPLTWKYNLSMGVVSDKQHVGVMASSSHYTPILEHYSTRLKSIGFQLRITITHGVLNMSIILFRFPVNRVSHSHQNVIMFIMKTYSKCTYLRTHFANYLSRKYIVTLCARSSTTERRSRYRARAVLLHAMVRATPAEFLCAGT